MSNGELQPKSEAKPRLSRIKKGITRTLQTEKYQSIVIHVETEEEIFWTSIEDRDRKMKNWETLLIKDFKQSHDNILNELGLEHKKAYFVDHVAEKESETNNLDGLDNLDNLE